MGKNQLSIVHCPLSILLCRPYISHCPQSGEGLGGRDTGGRGGGYRNKKRILAHPDFPLRAR